jgi:hypothetical protein
VVKKASQWYHPVSCSSCRGSIDPFSATSFVYLVDKSHLWVIVLLPAPGTPLRLARLFTNCLAHFVPPQPRAHYSGNSFRTHTLFTNLTRLAVFFCPSAKIRSFV